MIRDTERGHSSWVYTWLGRTRGFDRICFTFYVGHTKGPWISGVTKQRHVRLVHICPRCAHYYYYVWPLAKRNIALTDSRWQPLQQPAALRVVHVVGWGVGCCSTRCNRAPVRFTPPKSAWHAHTHDWTQHGRQCVFLLRTSADAMRPTNRQTVVSSHCCDTHRQL